MNLAAQLAALCVEHNLLNVSISANNRGGEVWFDASAQAQHGADRICSFGVGPETGPEARLKSAIEGINAQRAKPVIVDEMEAAQ